MRIVKGFIATLLLSVVTLLAVTVHANVASPSITITGDTNEEGNYISAVEIELSVESSDFKIEYSLLQPSGDTGWRDYSSPINISRPGNYRIRYRSIEKSTGVASSVEALVFIIDMELDETYPNVVRNGQIMKYKNTNENIVLPIYEERDEEVRGIWVSTVSNIDISKYSTEQDYKAELLKILRTVENNNLNTIFFQVRSMNDAFFESDYAPFSRYITGVEGVGVGWDIFEFFITEAHKRGIEVHAWLNPYRVSSGGNAEGSRPEKEVQLQMLHDDNFAKQNPDMVLADQYNNLILDPSNAVVRQYLVNVIDEILEKYDVDGIHFDDYFYIRTTEDTDTWINTSGGMSLEDWRRNNVDMMIKDIHDTVKEHNQTNEDVVKFGVSPAGIWKNGGDGTPTSGYASYGSPLFADTRKWVLEEWIDYIIPQVYWDFNQTAAPHADIVKWWAETIENAGVDVALIIGQGMYRYRDANPWTNEDAIIEQIRYASKYDAVKGITFFTFKDLLSSNYNIRSTLDRLNNTFWTKKVPVPWNTNVVFEDSAVVIIVKDEIRDLLNANKFLTDNYLVADGLDTESLLVTEDYVYQEDIDIYQQAYDDTEEALGFLISEQEILDIKNNFLDAIQTFINKTFKGTFDPQLAGALNNLEREYNQALIIFNVVNDAQGKTAAELDKGKNYVDTEYYVALENALDEASDALENELITSEEINIIIGKILTGKADVTNNYFPGQKEPGSTVGPDDVKLKLNPGIDTVYLDQPWFDEGIYSDEVNNITYETNSNVNIHAVGSYEVIYTATEYDLEIKRIVTVLPKQKEVSLTLNKSIDTIKVGDSWSDPGIIALVDGENAQYEIIGLENGNLVYEGSGSFKITYKVTVNDQEYIITRFVHVLAEEDFTAAIIPYFKKEEEELL